MGWLMAYAGGLSGQVPGSVSSHFGERVLSWGPDGWLVLFSLHTVLC